MSELRYELLEDFKDYNQSSLLRISLQEYAEKGADVFNADKTKDIVPNAITNSYPHALSLARIVVSQLKKITLLADEKFLVLECGCGSGLFTRNFLTACRNLEILDKIHYLASDFAETFLNQIKLSDLLCDFNEGEHYSLITLDLLNIDLCKNLTTSQSYDLKNLDFVILNYVLDVLPMSVYKKVLPNEAAGASEDVIDSESKLINDRNIEAETLKHSPKFQKLQLKLSKPEAKQSVLAELKVEERWQETDFNELEKLEFKHLEVLKSYADVFAPDTRLHFSYGAVEVIKQLIIKLSERGFIYACEVPFAKYYETTNYQIYNNVLVHMINLGQLKLSLVDETPADTYGDNYFQRLIIAKNSETYKSYQLAFKREFIYENNTTAYYEIKQAIRKLKSPQSIKYSWPLIENLKTLDPVSATYWYFKAEYHNLTYELTEAYQAYLKVQELDITSEYEIKEKLASLAKALQINN